MRRRLPVLAFAALMVANDLQAACCYFSAKNADIQLRKSVHHLGPGEKVETFWCSQFRGNALTPGMVIRRRASPSSARSPISSGIWRYSIMKKGDARRS